MSLPMKQYLRFVLVWLLLFGVGAFAQSPVSVDLRSEQARAATVKALADSAAARKQAAVSMARAKGWAVRGVTPAGRVFELMSLNEYGRPMYYITCNATAAVSTAANLVRDTAPYHVSGSNLLVGIWDAGAVRTNHQEFLSPNRVFVKDGCSRDDHATHVGGTIAAKGHVAAAKGMAPAASIHSYDWNSDLSEMTAAAATNQNQTNRIYVSNHSYSYLAGWEYGLYSGYEGWHWFGADMADREDRYFGQYGTEARDWDSLCHQAVYFLPFVVAANDRDDDAPAPGTTFRFNGTNYVYNASIHPYSDGYKQGGYNTVAFMGVAKNVLTVGAVDDASSGGVRYVPGATMTAFSGWGPTDDGRVKPDVVANGVGVYSPVASGTGSYDSYSGTSMAAPNSAGSALLLIEYYRALFPLQYMRAATLKGLIIHTADDLGTPGPDYVFGWGLMDTKAAADHILSHHEQPSARFIIEDTLTTENPTKDYTFLWDGANPIRATLSWTDPQGTAQSGLNSTNRNLVNDLDLRVFAPGGTTNFPYVLSRADPTNAATFGDNQVDNVEQVYIASPSEAGTYTLRVTRKGSLSGNQQAFSILLSGTTENTEVTLSNFVWSAIGSPQYTNIPFAATITAKDSLGDVASDFDGMAELCGYSSWTGTIGTNDWIWGVPLSSYWEDGRSQILYLQSEIGAPATINGLGLNIHTIPPQMLMSWTIRLKHTAVSAFLQPAFDGPGADWTTVFRANVTIASTGWVLFAFSTPFEYNGVSNLIVDLSFNNSTWSSNGWVYVSGRTNRLVYAVSDSEHGDPLDWNGTNNPQTLMGVHVPNIRLRAERVVGISPTETGEFTNGVWSGMITVGEPAAGVFLRATGEEDVTGDSNRFDVQAQAATSRIVTVVSAYGTPSPAGITLTNRNSSLSARLTGSPVSGGEGIQYECVGASVTGNNFTQDTPTNLTMTITNDVTIVWQWTTNYWLAPFAGANGSVNVTPGWRAAGATTTITATADTYYHFTNWTGDVSGGQETQNPLDLIMVAPKSIEAHFSLNMTTSAPVAVPELWLAGFGLTEDFEDEVLDDADEDGALTWQEYVMDTDPTNRHSVLSLDTGSSQGAGYMLHWFASTERIYALYMSTNQPGVVTNALFTGFQPDETGTATYTDAVHSVNERIYYRVKVAFPEE